jgi:hypothetical protein
MLTTERLGHAVILCGSLGVSLCAAFTGHVGPGAGISACWIQPHGSQAYFFYAIMAPVILCGVIFSLVSSWRLWLILRRVPDLVDDDWTARHRPLRRVVYGNIVWTFSVIVVGAIPVLDYVMKNKVMCWLANVNVSILGVIFVVDFYVLPFYLERCLERTRPVSPDLTQPPSAEEPGGHAALLLASKLEESSASPLHSPLLGLKGTGGN